MIRIIFGLLLSIPAFAATTQLSTQIKQPYLYESLATTATAGGTTTLVCSSVTTQIFTGSSNQTIVLPAANASGCVVGRPFVFVNESTGILTINKNGGSLVTTITGKVVDPLTKKVTLSDSGSSAGSWTVDQGGIAPSPVPTYTYTFAGDLTGTVGPTPNATVTIAASSVTNAKLANMADQTVKGNVSGGSAAPSDLSKAQLTTLVNPFTASLSGAVPTPGPTRTSGVLQYDGNWVDFAGGGAAITVLNGPDVVSNPGPTASATIQANVVTDAKLRQSAALSVIGNSTNGTANVADMTASSDFQVLRRSGTALGFGAIDLAASGAVGTSVLTYLNGGTGLNSATAGDLIYSSATNTWSRLAKGTLNQVLTMGASFPQWSDPVLVGSRNEVWLYTANGYGSTNTKIRRYSTVGKNLGNIPCVDSATLGTTCTIGSTGIFAITECAQFTSTGNHGISVNSSQLTTDINSITAADRLAWVNEPTGDYGKCITITTNLNAGDIVRPHTNGATTGASVGIDEFRITQVSY